MSQGSEGESRIIWNYFFQLGVKVKLPREEGRRNEIFSDFFDAFKLTKPTKSLLIFKNKSKKNFLKIFTKMELLYVFIFKIIIVSKFSPFFLF